ncbi:hypothetical protein KGF57_004608 [Candida theae]|uniref:WD repeat-containing protein 48 n=1 Tax=Candida theae TaxID=1198502 RepID=A0AAD5BB26_9ASCO|nr:uncharacterized protein KGF57_004608 [Candida theae]KAI5949785.1 hypothetical protein KGF57_004608 [Candida theae]
MRGISYGIGDHTSSSHILPINQIVYSPTQRKLFTAGRDGSVKIWNQEWAQEPKEPTTTTDTFETSPEELALKLETQISANPLPYRRNTGTLTIANSFNLHFDWVNDLQQVGESVLASASNDLSLKLLNFHNGDVHKLPNVHIDYIKKIQTTQNNGIVSAGLDSKIVTWDLNNLSPLATLNNQDGVYSLSCNATLIAAGGASSVVNLYDVRSSSRIRTLIGHQDNVRSLLMDDRYVISGSSDTTIKMWDLRTFKVYKNFDIHDFPVWAMSGDSRCFYSGDRDGNIVKTDLSNLFINKDDQYFENTFTTNECTSIDEKLGISTIIAQNESPILSICHNDDSIFISDYDSLSRYVNPNTSRLSQYQLLKTCLDYSPNDDSLDEAQPNDDLNSMFHDLVSHLSNDTANNEVQSNYSAEQFEPGESYNSMFLNVNGGPSTEFVNAYQSGLVASDGFVDTTPIEILLNPSDQISPIPFNLKPITRHEIAPHSVVSKRLLNNKRQIMALYLNGDIRMWDILIGKELKKFPGREDKLLSGKELEYRLKEMDDLVQKYQTSDTLNNWCEVEIKAGKLLVTIKETSVMNVEVYYDDMVRDYPYLAIDHPETVARMGQHKSLAVGDDDRFHLGLIFLNSIFHGYTMYEWVFDELVREELRQSKPGTADNESITGRLKNWRKSSKRNLTDASPISSANVSVNEMPINPPLSEFLGTPEESLIKRIPQYNDTIMSLLQANKKLYQEQTKSESALRVNRVNPGLGIRSDGNDEELRYFPVINVNHFPPDMNVILFEYSPELGNYRDLSSFNIRNINNLLEFPQRDLIDELRCSLPRWIGNPILYNRFSLKEPPKITFRLLEVDYFNLPSTVKIGGKSQRKIKSLPALESSIKLTSHNMLRVSKILYFLTDKFDGSTKEMRDKKLKPTDWLVLECKGQELSNSMTLQTIKTKVWKSSSDIELRYRRRFD